MSQEDFYAEPVRGLPEMLPDGEAILWQGSPDTVALARQALGADWVAGYFLVLALWRGIVNGSEAGLAAGLTAASWYVVIGAISLAVVGLTALAMARTTVYTLTTHRVAMRIGAALSGTLNLPYRWIRSADLVVRRDGTGTGTIALHLKGDTRLSYLVLWPHVKPWSLARARPALRCIAEPQRVAAILARAAAADVAEIQPAPGLAGIPLAAE